MIRQTKPIHGAAAAAAPWIERTARVGFAAKALLYMIVGVLALQGARGAGGRNTGTRGALSEIIGKPFGKALLVVMAMGLVGYAVWRVVEGIADPGRKGSNAKGLALRTSIVIRGLAHGALAVQALRVAFSQTSRTDDGANARAATSRAMDMPFGEWMVMLAGAGIAAYGAYQIYRAWQSKLSKQLDFGALHAETGRWAIPVSRFGIAARGVVFAMVGVLFVHAGWDANANEAGGVGAALSALGTGTYGRVILAIVAVGMIAYGAYEAIQSRYRRIDTGA